MKKIIAKAEDNCRIEVEVDKQYPNYCQVAIFNFDDDMVSIEIETAEVLRITTEILKEVS